MKKAYFTINKKLLICWIALSVIYFGGLKIVEIYLDLYSEIPELAIMLLFLWTAPIFTLASGILAYKATSRVIIPNLVTIAIMGLINLYDCFADAKEAYRIYVCTYPSANTFFGRYLLQTFIALFQISLLVFIVLLIISAITKWFSDSRKSNDICQAPSSTSEQEVKKAKIASISKQSNYFIVWIALSINYFVGLKIFEMFDHSDIPGLATVLLFIFSAPFFSVISGVLEYKATSKVILPNLLNVVVMILVNAMDCFEEAEESYQQAIRIGHSCTFGEKALEIFALVLLIALPIFIISVIASAITKWIHKKKEKKLEQTNDL